ncbi:hypothetical protein AAVH_29925 [Aphelenchoides avenae]|nr:hypothetical protein AAVH_29925 [Aphelenchus avenae]
MLRVNAASNLAKALTINSRRALSLSASAGRDDKPILDQAKDVAKKAADKLSDAATAAGDKLSDIAASKTEQRRERRLEKLGQGLAKKSIKNFGPDKDSVDKLPASNVPRRKRDPYARGMPTQ